MKAFLFLLLSSLLQNSLLHYSYFNYTGGAHLKETVASLRLRVHSIIVVDSVVILQLKVSIFDPG